MTELLPSDTRFMHASDCAIYNEPALPAGPCSCRATPKTDGVAYVYRELTASPHEDQELEVVPADFARTQERRIAELEQQLQEANQVGSDYDAALCTITFNLHEPESAKIAQKALDKHALGTPQ